MLALLLLAVVPAAEFPEAGFFRSSAPAFSKMTIGSSPMLEPQRFTLGVDADLVRFPLLPNPVQNNMPVLSAGYAYSFSNAYGSYMFLRGGVYPRSAYTLSSAGVLAAGFGIRPPPVAPLSVRLSYGTLGPLEFYPGDAYDNYRISQLHTLNLDVSASTTLWRITGQAAVGGSLTYLSGDYRKDLGTTDKPYFGLVPGWWADAALKFWRVRLSAGIAGGMLHAGLGLQTGL
jgi:hypothetical protein